MIFSRTDRMSQWIASCELKKNQGWLQGLSLCIKVNKNVITKKGGARERSLRV